MNRYYWHVFYSGFQMKQALDTILPRKSSFYTLFLKGGRYKEILLYSLWWFTHFKHKNKESFKFWYSNSRVSPLDCPRAHCGYCPRDSKDSIHRKSAYDSNYIEYQKTLQLLFIALLTTLINPLIKLYWLKNGRP